MEYILIITFALNSTALATTSVRFDDMAACEAARFGSFKYEKSDDQVKVAAARCFAAGTTHEQARK